MASERDPLLPVHGEGPESPSRRNWKTWIKHGILLILVLSTVIFFYFFSSHKSKGTNEKPKFVIMMVSDGMGPGSLSMTRSFVETLNDKEGYRLPLDEHLIGSSRTRSSSSLITDSAAGATAFSCANKTYNGAVGVLDNEKPCGTILEAAKEAGYLTGIVVTSRVTDATPASFSAHAANRFMQDLIAEYQVGMGPLGRSVDLLFGGGLCSFLPKSTYRSCRSDNLDLLKYARKKEGFQILLNRTDFDELSNAQLPLLGLFSDYHLSYDIDYQPEVQPKLSEMVETALDVLLNATNEDTSKGFFLLIEGSRIDMASHNNDPIAHVYEVMEYNRAFEIASAFVEKNGGSLISTSDHETGGLTVGRQVSKKYPEYLWKPQVLSLALHSIEYLASAIVNHNQNTLLPYIEQFVLPAIGIPDPNPKQIHDIYVARHNIFNLINVLSDIVSVEAQIGWTTHGHTAVDVNVYGVGEVTEHLRGNMENIEIGQFMEIYLNVSLSDVTEKLKDAPIHGAPDRPSLVETSFSDRLVGFGADLF
ncbi:vacuolar membrane alkaline phosphatase [Schizosaccharomyces pombe]|uniref:Alkaline phosphatase n=1 Tax=Schizosaccharomyces pombe (strain 972 / ATCC 24843) TaxID=284812 RepID=PPB_SCHPO|nr:putative alkaline phosphatase [Schizosaccharomyces pombe]O60109.1 RecName: Full=Alkaline phosphatase [Schizosaccharomyces pombe 972h-]CAA19331.1 vacuolar membrane alkaline phosphatase (predicted) [Schizosaccharomyces pombe]|eukprot:NP_596739.1 putative alkaline phosphatase [Schizosaccharomyces pombe]